jgi:hypothetical protein
LWRNTQSAIDATRPFWSGHDSSNVAVGIPIRMAHPASWSGNRDVLRLP